ncbi:MAG: HAD-IA family hydrolase [Flavobacteriaceae bacterium]|nr:HAD-IA family hydrolase [Flavobacteriaceae bacterium]
MKNIALIIFDLDGTLVNSQYDLGDGVNFALKKLGKPLIPQTEVPKMLGSGIRKLLEFSMGNFSEQEMTKALDLFMSYYSANYTNKTTYYPEVPGVLQYFAGLKKAVYSNKFHPFTVDILKTLAIDHYFEVIQGITPDGFPPKPDPAGMHLISEKLKIKPENILMVGDSTHDIEAGKRAGTLTCAVTYGYRPLAVLREAGPDFMIDNLDELKLLIRN